MTTITPELARGAVFDSPADNYLTHSRGFKSWALTLDHKRIGVMYLIAVLSAFFMGGVFAMIVRTQLLSPNGVIFTKSGDYTHYNQMFTLHGAIMVFLVLVPGIPGALGELRAADHARRQRCRLSASQPLLVLSLCDWCRLRDSVDRDRRGGHRLDVLHTLFGGHRDCCLMHGLRCVHTRILLDPHRHELHCHHPQTPARPA